MRRGPIVLVGLVVVLVVLLVVGDRVAHGLAERTLAREVQRSADLPSRPTVRIEGVPFLTQALRGRYDRIRVTARDVPGGAVPGSGAAPDITARRLTATLRGARVPLSDALSGSVTRIPVDRTDATVLLGYDELAAQAGDRDVELSPAGDRLRVRGRVELLGRELTASALSRLVVDDGDLLVRAESVDVGNDVADRLISGALQGRLDFRIDLGQLPFGLEVQDVAVRQDGVAITARAAGTVLEQPAT